MPHWLRNAFAIERVSADKLPADEAAAIERLVAAIVRRRMTGPALLLLEASRPLNFLIGQLLLFAQPTVGLLLTQADLSLLFRYFQRHGSMEHLCSRLEAASAEQAPR